MFELHHFLHIVKKFIKDKTMRLQLIVSFKRLKESKELVITANNDFFTKNNQVDFFKWIFLYVVSMWEFAPKSLAKYTYI